MDDFAAIGVRSVLLVSDGKSTLSKPYVPIIQHSAEQLASQGIEASILHMPTVKPLDVERLRVYAARVRITSYPPSMVTNLLGA